MAFPFRLPQRSPPCQDTSQGLPRLQPARTKILRVANRQEFSNDSARSGTIPVRRREERVCGDAAITHRCSCPREPRVLSPHRLQGAAILLARPMNEAGLPVRHVRCSATVKARLRELVDVRGGVFTCGSGAACRDWVEATLRGAQGRPNCPSARTEERVMVGLGLQSRSRLGLRVESSLIVLQADVTQPPASRVGVW